MLQFLRKRGNMKKIMWGLAILIVPAFVLWGSGSTVRSKQLPKYAGEIFGNKVTFREYENALAACHSQALLIYGDNFKKVAQFLDFNNEAWQRLLLLHQVRKENIKVIDQEVVGFIEKLPFFQEESRFSPKRYKIILDYAFGISPRTFEEQIREILTIDKLKDTVTSKIALSEEQVKAAYTQENEKAKAIYVFIDPQKFTEEIHPAYEELERYYQNHQNEFQKPEQVNAQYIALYFDSGPTEGLAVQEQEIQDYYQQNLDQFKIKDEKGQESTKPQEQVEQQIRERLLQDKVKLNLEDKIWQIYDQLNAENSSFEETAKENKLEVKETGFFGPQQAIAEIGLSYEFSNTAFGLKIGEISNIIETPKGYFVIKIKARKESYVPPIDEIKAEVEKSLVREKSWQLAKEKGQQLLNQINDLVKQENLTLTKAAEKLALTLNKTEEFSRSSYISGLGQSPMFAQAALALEVGKISELVPVANGFCILSPTEIIPIDEEKFIQEKEEFSKKLLAKKQQEALLSWLDDLRQEAKLIDHVKPLTP